MLDVGEYFWLYLVAATEHQAGYAQIFHQISAAVSSKKLAASNKLFDDSVKQVAQKCCCGNIAPSNKEPVNGVKVLLAGLRRPMERHGVRALVERLELESLGVGEVFTYSPETVFRADSAMVLFGDSKHQIPPDHLFIVPPGVSVIF